MNKKKLKSLLNLILSHCLSDCTKWEPIVYEGSKRTWVIPKGKEIGSNKALPASPLLGLTWAHPGNSDAFAWEVPQRTLQPFSLLQNKAPGASERAAENEGCCMAGIGTKDRFVFTWITWGILPFLLEERKYWIWIVKIWATGIPTWLYFRNRTTL